MLIKHSQMYIENGLYLFIKQLVFNYDPINYIEILKNKLWNCLNLPQHG